MLVRRLELSDAPLLQAVRLTIDADSPGTLGSPSQRKQALQPEQIANKESAAYGAFIQGVLVGTAFIAPTLSVPKWFGLFAVGVLPEFRGRKLSRILVHDCLAYAESEGAEGVMLAVNVPNPAAKSLYDSLEFEVWNTTEHAYVYEGIQYDELLMRKVLKGA